eukprot:m.121343 g.121343  ORF g.121343 m.121343 type:complete len:148 (+) comp37751_c0_seq1:2468-2911(+)
MEELIFNVVRLSDFLLYAEYPSISSIKGPFEELTENLGKPTVVDTYDFKLSSEKFRRLDLRVAKLDDGKLNLYAAFANEAKTFTANWVFLDKQSDVRISLSTRICVSLRNPEIRKFLESIKLRYTNSLFSLVLYFRILIPKEWPAVC